MDRSDDSKYVRLVAWDLLLRPFVAKIASLWFHSRAYPETCWEKDPSRAKTDGKLMKLKKFQLHINLVNNDNWSTHAEILWLDNSEHSF